MPSHVPCHHLPCGIDYDGNAPVHIYFRPTPLASDDDEDGGAEAAPRPPSGGSPQAPPPAPDAKDLRGVLAAQLRGRGLLAVGPVQLPSGVTGTVLSKAGGGEGGLEVLATFGSVHEWRHEHEVRTVRKRDLGREGLMRRAGDWIGIARSVHDPL